MTGVLKVLGITFLVMGLLLGTIAGLGEFSKYQKAMKSPEAYDTGRCESANCMVPFEKSAPMQESLNQWARSQSPIPQG